MLKQIRNQLITEIKDALNFELVDKYRGEFEQGSDWNPRLRNCFIQVMGKARMVTLADLSTGKAKNVLRIYAGANNRHSYDALDVMEPLEDFLHNTRLTFTADGNTYNAKLNVPAQGWDLIYTDKGFEGYAMNLDVLCTQGQVTIPLPEQVELVSPADEQEDVEVNNADFEFEASAGADDYEILISSDEDFSDTVFRQPRYKYLKLTLPNDILENDETYYWKVRARNQGGNSEWSEARSFTTGTPDIVPPLNPSQISNNILWLRADTGITLSGAKVTQWDDQSPSAFHVSNATDANRPSLINNVFGNKSAVYFNPGSIHCLAKADTTALFKLTGAESKSFMITQIGVSAGSSANALLGRGNTSNGLQWKLHKASLASLGIDANYYSFPKGTFATGEICLPFALGYLRQIIFTVNNTTVKMYINGELIAEQVTTFNGGVIPDNASTFYTLGSAYFNNVAQGVGKLYMFENAWWSKVLSADEIASLYEYHKIFFEL